MSTKDEALHIFCGGYLLPTFDEATQEDSHDAQVPAAAFPKSQGRVGGVMS